MTIVEGEVLAGRWRLGERLGRGAVADVFEATDTSGGRVAVKMLRHVDAPQRARFEREVTALGELDHPSIVGVRGHGELAGRPYVVLERVDGGTLADELVAKGPLPVERACALGAALAEALDHAHRRGVVHRDVKPSNVLLGQDGRPRLADFGVAQLDGAASLTASGFTVGTPAYLAPEQVQGQPVGPAADVYALGLLVLEALTGQRAYPGTGLSTAMARLLRPPEVPGWIPPALAGRLEAMTAAEPAARPSAASLALDLGALSEAVDDTAVLRVADDATAVVAVAGAGEVVRPPVPTAAPTPGLTSPLGRVALAVACFAVGFLLVLAVRAAGSGGDIADQLPPATTAVPAETVPTAAPTTVPVTTAPPPAPAPEPREGGRGRGNGRDRDD